jgi:hypothetical protein
MSLAPPQGGTPPPPHVTFGGSEIPLRPLAQEICRRYRAEFPDEQGRYGDAGAAWCVHDNQHVLNWAFLGVTLGNGMLALQVSWLADVLSARDFPLVRLVRDLELAADVVLGQVDDAEAVADALLAARASVPV